MYNFGVSSQYPIFFLVLWVLGACMIISRAGVDANSTPATDAVATIVLHHLVDGINARSLVWYGAVESPFRDRRVFPFAGRTFIRRLPRWSPGSQSCLDSASVRCSLSLRPCAGEFCSPLEPVQRLRSSSSVVRMSTANPVPWSVAVNGRHRPVIPEHDEVPALLAFC